MPDANARRNVYSRSHLGQARGIRRVGKEIGGSQRSSNSGQRALKRLGSSSSRPSAGFKEPLKQAYDPYS